MFRNLAILVITFLPSLVHGGGGYNAPSNTATDAVLQPSTLVVGPSPRTIDPNSVFTSSGPMRLVSTGTYGGGTELPGDGAFVITNTLNQNLAFQIYSNAATVTGPLMMLRHDNTSAADGLLQILHDGTAGGAYQLKLQGPAPQIEWVEADQTTPAGKYETGGNGDFWYVAGRNAADSAFEIATQWTRIGLDGGRLQHLGNQFSVGISSFAVSGGSVGVSTGTPQTTLDVNGNAQFGSGTAKSTFTAAGILNMGAEFTPLIRTKAQVDAITAAVGRVVICSDCTVPYDICVGTGTGLSGFRAVVNSAINTAIPGTLVNKGCGSGN